MTTTTAPRDRLIAQAARAAAGNWRSFEHFTWSRERDLTDPEQWMIHYTRHRDSGLREQSNAARIRSRLARFLTGDDPDVVEESHEHWGVGYLEGFSLRVSRNGRITDAFRTLDALLESLAADPFLDELDYSARVFAATLDNIEQAAECLGRLDTLPENWSPRVFGWLRDHRPHSLVNSDDRGGCPSDDDLNAAFDALGWTSLPPTG